MNAAISDMATFGKAPASEGGRYIWIARGGRVYYDAIWSWLERLRVTRWAT